MILPFPHPIAGVIGPGIFIVVDHPFLPLPKQPEVDDQNFDAAGSQLLGP
jgi:hypothetical protein